MGSPVIIPFADLSREHAALRDELHAAAARVLDSGRSLYGPELEAIEREIADWHGVKYAVGVASGTDAVEIALRATSASDPSTGVVDSADVTAMTAPATINAMEASGTIPILKDIDPVTRNARNCDLQVHLYGLAEDATRADVEDVAHAMGATWNGQLAGTMGRCGALSAYPSKILGAAGDGGVIITNDAEIAEACRLIRHYGLTETRDIQRRGQNSRLSEMQAAILRVKLPHVNEWIERRQAIARQYDEELFGHVTIPATLASEGREDYAHDVEHVYHVYVIESPERDRIAAHLRERGISTMVHYGRAIHQYTRWAHLGEPGQFPNAERLAAECLSLPLYPFLRDDEVDAVIAAVKEAT